MPLIQTVSWLLARERENILNKIIKEVKWQIAYFASYIVELVVKVVIAGVRFYKKWVS